MSTVDPPHRFLRHMNVPLVILAVVDTDALLLKLPNQGAERILLAAVQNLVMPVTSGPVERGLSIAAHFAFSQSQLAPL